MGATAGQGQNQLDRGRAQQSSIENGTTAQSLSMFGPREAGMFLMESFATRCPCFQARRDLGKGIWRERLFDSACHVGFEACGCLGSSA